MSKMEGRKEEHPLEGQQEDKRDDEGGRQGENSDTDSDISILRRLQGLRNEGVGRQGHTKSGLEVVEEEETKEQPRQERRRNVTGQREPHPSREVGPEVVEKEAQADGREAVVRG